ncbi:zinc finger, CCHC-type containing protein [Tanacetum coccineum]
MMGLNMLLDIVIPDYNALCPIKAKSCTYGCCCPKHKQYDYQVDSPGRETYWFKFHKMVSQFKDCSQYYETVNLQQEVACLMLSSMSPDLQRTLEKYNAYDMLKELKTMFEEQAKQELFETVKAFHACYAMPNELGVSLILNSINKDYDQFVQNYNMHSMGKTIAELHAMLKLYEKSILKKAETPIVLAIWEGKIQKNKKKLKGAKGKDKGKNKLAYAPKPKIPPLPKRDNLAKDYVCHHSMEGLRGSRKLKHGAFSLYMGNGMTVSREGASYFITFIDDFSYGYVYLMKHKHEVFETFKVFQNKVENQLGKKIKAIQSDQGGEYLSHEFVNHIKSCGIVSQLTLPYTPQHNMVYERRNRTLLDMVRSMMNLTTLPKSFWGYALESAARILNMVPTKKIERTLYEIWHGKAPKLSYLRIFVARNVEFFENSLMVQEASGSHGLFESSGSGKGLEFIQEEDTQPSKNTSKVHNEVAPIEVEPQNVEVPIHRSARIPQAPDIYGFYVDVEEYELGDLNEPPNYKAALSYPEFDKWIEAMNTEMQSMKDNQVWVLVDLPPNG